MRLVDAVATGRRNFLRSTNPFNLSDPPAWFLDQLLALDAELVIFASIHEACYRLCRRVTRSKDLTRPVGSFPDTRILVAFRLAPWKSVMPTSLDMSWASLLQEIPAYDQWRVGSGDQVADLLDRRDEGDHQKLLAQQQDDLRQLSGYTYGVAARMRGSRTGLSDRPWGGVTA